MDSILPSDRPYVIAEIGGNHGGDVETARRYVKAAADAGADAAKFQLYQAENLITRDHPPLPLANDDSDSQFERFKDLELDREQWLDIMAVCEECNIDFAASVFDTEMVDFVADRTPFLKIASGDLTNVPLLRYATDTGKPLIVSTGFATMDEIRRAIDELQTDRLVLLHCMGSYPTPDEDANLQLIQTLRDLFDVPTGYSDHTVGTLAPIVAAGHGARIIEKHFTLDKSNPVGDHRLSATPEELATIIREGKRAFSMVGDSRRSTVFQAETDIRYTMRRSLAAARDLEAGTVLTAEDLMALRPASGISPLEVDDVIGREITEPVSRGTVIENSQIKWNRF